MLIDRWRKIETLYHSARERSAEERRAYLESACGGDETLLHEVESLLANDDLADEFLETHSEAQGIAGSGYSPDERSDRM